MVFKLTSMFPESPALFENDVKEYGFQAHELAHNLAYKFENDVKEYGFQADSCVIPVCIAFENDVKEYGFQAADPPEK